VFIVAHVPTLSALGIVAALIFLGPLLTTWLAWRLDPFAWFPSARGIARDRKISVAVIAGFLNLITTVTLGCMNASGRWNVLEVLPGAAGTIVMLLLPGGVVGLLAILVLEGLSPKK
jgi:hypothetical protein